MVEKPGEYPYRPDLTVIQAISIAGGLPRVADPALMRLQREITSARGNLEVLELERISLMARRARLEAEVAEQSAIVFPQDLSQQSNPAVSRIVREEESIFTGRQEALKSQIEAFGELQNLIRNEISSLESKLVLKDKQLNLLRRELSSVETLVTKGLAVAPRQFSLERAEADIETSRLEIETSLLRAKQDVSRTGRDIL